MKTYKPYLISFSKFVKLRLRVVQVRLLSDPLPLPTEDIMDLLNLRLTSVYFEYNSKHHKQVKRYSYGVSQFQLM